MKDPLLSQRFSQPVSRLVMRVPRNSPAILVLAVTLAAAAAAVSSGSSASKIQTPDSKTSLVSYFAEWHGTAIASSNGANAAGGNFGESTTWEFSGSAIIHYGEDGPGFWTYRDSKFLNLVDSFELAQWQESGACNSYQAQTYTLLDSGLDDALIRLWTPNRALKADTRRVNLFFQTTYERGRLQKHWVQCGQAGNEVNQESPRPVVADVADAVNSPWDLIADKDDISSFSVHNQFKADLYGRQSDVDWSAHAYRLGKCSEQQGPIEDNAGIVDHHEVAVKAVDQKISPDGKTQVRITVKCDGVLVKGAKLNVSIEPEVLTGGHNHSFDRPRGYLNGTELSDANPSSANPNATTSIPVETGPNGEVDVKFEPPRKFPGRTGSKTGGIGGDYKLTATSVRFSSSTSNDEVTVTAPGLIPLPDNPNYEVCGNSDLGCKPGDDGVGKRGKPEHPDGMQGTLQTITAFAGLAADFLQQEQAMDQQLHSCNKELKPIRKVSINDIALPNGGKFDLDRNWGKNALDGHQTHGAGLGGDFNHFKETGTFQDCLGFKYKWEVFWTDTLLSLGQKYGHWDAYDQSQPNKPLHLHVGD